MSGFRSRSGTSRSSRTSGASKSVPRQCGSGCSTGRGFAPKQCSPLQQQSGPRQQRAVPSRALQRRAETSARPPSWSAASVIGGGSSGETFPRGDCRFAGVNRHAMGGYHNATMPRRLLCDAKARMPLVDRQCALAECRRQPAAGAAARDAPAGSLGRRRGAEGGNAFGHVHRTRRSRGHRPDLRARVEGFIEQRLFDDGADVKAGDLLVVLEKASYEAQIGEIKGQITAAEGALRLTEIEVNRQRSSWRKRL